MTPSCLSSRCVDGRSPEITPLRIFDQEVLALTMLIFACFDHRVSGSLSFGPFLLIEFWVMRCIDLAEACEASTRRSSNNKLRILLGEECSKVSFCLPSSQGPSQGRRQCRSWCLCSCSPDQVSSADDSGWSTAYLCDDLMILAKNM